MRGPDTTKPWGGIIQKVNSPLKFYALALLVVFALILSLATASIWSAPLVAIVRVLLAFLVILVVGVVALSIWRPQALR